MTTLLVGFDSAWTPTKRGALVGLVRADDGTFKELDIPRGVNYSEAESKILGWQDQEQPATTIVLLDQPTIVENATGQRPVENLVASPVSRRYGGVQPANTARGEMFGSGAPVRHFLQRFGGPASPLEPVAGTRVLETYPVLTMIALGWTLPDTRPTGRLPKYNPERRRTFSLFDWEFVCQQTSCELAARGLQQVVGWLDVIAKKPSPRKEDQDCLDACLCLLVALYLDEGRECLMVGDMSTGYILVPSSESLRKELEARCEQTGRAHSAWVHFIPRPSDKTSPHSDRSSDADAQRSK